MRILVAIIALAAAAWTGWWFFVAEAKERAIAGWLEERRAAGWVAEAQAIDVGGFPYRVDTTVLGLQLANPEEAWAWTAPEFQFLTLAYKPNHLIVFWPPQQSFATPLGAVDVRSQTMRGSVTVEPNLGLALDHATVELGEVELDGGEWRVDISSAIVATRQAAGEGAAPFAHDVSFDAKGIELPEDLLRVDRSGVLSSLLETARVEGTASFSGPWDRAAVEGTPPTLEGLVVRDLQVTWGALDLRGRGEVAADGDGLAEGEFELRAREWRRMLDVAEESGALSSGAASALRGGLGLLARLGGDERALDVTLEFRDGRTFLGPVPVGPAPRLAAR